MLHGNAVLDIVDRDRPHEGEAVDLLVDIEAAPVAAGRAVDDRAAALAVDADSEKAAAMALDVLEPDVGLVDRRKHRLIALLRRAADIVGVAIGPDQIAGRGVADEPADEADSAAGHRFDRCGGELEAEIAGGMAEGDAGDGIDRHVADSDIVGAGEADAEGARGGSCGATGTRQPADADIADLDVMRMRGPGLPPLVRRGVGGHRVGRDRSHKAPVEMDAADHIGAVRNLDILDQPVMRAAHDLNGRRTDPVAIASLGILVADKDEVADRPPAGALVG